MTTDEITGSYGQISCPLVRCHVTNRYIRHISTQWSSYDYCLVLDQRCSDFSYYLYFNKVDSRPPRNLRDLRLGTPRANKALSDPVETKDHENSIRHCGRLHVSMVLHQDRLRRVQPMLTRLRRRLYAFSIAQEWLLDLDKEYGMKKWCTRRDKIS
uniref:OJ000315_02.2 protein n=1 Tax=Oryza sativa subsp. japonica TaxID=39947 RepID=Q7F8W9_ORYSJ|nr:OJ000315_02.2 [Oryza sativa Japonica Group]